MTREPFIAHSELTNEIYIVVGKEKYRVTEQAIKAVMAIKALEQEDILDKIREDINNLTVYYTTKDKGINLISQRAVNRVIDKYRK